MSQTKLTDEKDEFVESLNLTPEKIRQDMESMKGVEGFPIGDDDDILNLSYPPYYTEYPNPYIETFIEKYGKPYDEATDDYHREPFVDDISEGKNDPIYNAHSYHTKVPHRAIMKFIEHYTEPGDIVFDGFCGSGMTGVAARYTNRKAILADLSSTATFTSYNYNNPIDVWETEKDAKRVINEVEKEYGWLYETHLADGITKCKINYVVWSDIFICPHCKTEYVFWDIVNSADNEESFKSFVCENCSGIIDMKQVDKVLETVYDDTIKENRTKAKKIPVLINYLSGNKRYEKKPDDFDLRLIDKIQQMDIPFWYPTEKIMFKGYQWGDKWRKGLHIGLTNTHHFFIKRLLFAISILIKRWEHDPFNLQLVKNNIMNYSILSRVKQGVLPLAFYVPKMTQEFNIFEKTRNRLERVSKIYLGMPLKKNKYIISTQSSTDLRNIRDNSIDYIFVDPPFGENIFYSELNFIEESFLKAYTNINREAIISKSQRKDINEYKNLMFLCFREFYNKLKPKRWITVEFHNSSAAVWKAIQESISKAGFIIAQVSVLDKKQGSFNQVTADLAVKNDLVINAYKPKTGFSETFLKKAGMDMERDFIDMHLENLSVERNVERIQQMLYSKLIAQYIQNGFEVRMDASEFYDMLRNSPEHFEERDGYWFKKEQIPEYEKRLKLAKNIGKLDTNQLLLFVNDERTTIIWSSQFLREPKTYSEIYTEWTQKWNESQDKMPELKIILEENFTTEEGKYRLPSISEKKEREDVRERRLSREFQEILDTAISGKKIASVRKEALLHGLMKLYNERNVDVIRTIGKRLDKRLIESDEDIYAIIDWASSKED